MSAFHPGLRAEFNGAGALPGEVCLLHPTWNSILASCVQLEASHLVIQMISILYMEMNLTRFPHAPLHVFLI